MRCNRRWLVQIGITCLWAYTRSIVIAANSPVVPYVFVRGGLSTQIDWWAHWKEKFSLPLSITASNSWKDKLAFREMPISGGGGFTWNPESLDDWVASFEGSYSQASGDSMQSSKEDQILILGKITLPSTEGVEHFIGIGAGPVGLNFSRAAKSIPWGMVGFIDVGRRWHISQGCYFTMQLTYALPFSLEHRKQSATLSAGLHWNLL